MGTLCRGGTGGPSKGRRGKGGEGRGIFFEAQGVPGVTGGEEETVEEEVVVMPKEEVLEGKKA